jgi:hypothetical protein
MPTTSGAAAVPERLCCRAAASVRVALASIVAAVVLVAAANPAMAQAPVFESDTSVAAEGYYQLRWQAAGSVRLLESDTPGFESARTLYTGADTARIISGMPDGQRYYRLEDAATGARIGETVSVTVAHHPLDRALAFFTVGAIVFAATLGLIVVGSRTASA